MHPGRGYGTTLWRAMLMIKPAAGPVRNPQEWRDLTEELAERLRKRYDLAWRSGGRHRFKSAVAQTALHHLQIRTRAILAAKPSSVMR
jgi:hypothetical protein